MKSNSPYVVQRADGMVFITTNRFGQVLEQIRHGGSFSANSIAHRLNWPTDTAMRAMRVLLRYQLVMLVSHGISDEDNMYGETPYNSGFNLVHLSVNSGGKASTAEHGELLQFEDGKIVICAPTAASVIESFKVLPGLSHADHANICRVPRGLVSQISKHLTEHGLAVKSKDGATRTQLTMSYYVVRPVIRLTDNMIRMTNSKKKVSVE